MSGYKNWVSLRWQSRWQIKVWHISNVGTVKIDLQSFSIRAPRQQEEELVEKRHFWNHTYWAWSCGMQCNIYRRVLSSLGKHGQGNPLQRTQRACKLGDANCKVFTEMVSRFPTQAWKTKTLFAWCLCSRVWPYLREVEGHHTITIRVHGLKGFCRQKQRENTYFTITNLLLLYSFLSATQAFVFLFYVIRCFVFYPDTYSMLFIF